MALLLKICISTLIYQIFKIKLDLIGGIAEIWVIDRELKIKIPCYSGPTKGMIPFIKEGSMLGNHLGEFYIAQFQYNSLILDFKTFEEDYGNFKVLEINEYYALIEQDSYINPESLNTCHRLLETFESL